MKKGMSKVLSVLLIAVLVFTSGTAVFADTEQGQMVEEKTTVEKAALFHRIMYQVCGSDCTLFIIFLQGELTYDQFFDKAVCKGL